jgi:hypothetical protein
LNSKQNSIDSICKLVGSWEDKGVDTIYPIMEMTYKYIPDGTVLQCLFNNPGRITNKIKGKDEIDMDTRGGRLAWGLTKENMNLLDEEVLTSIQFHLEGFFLEQT